jgi:hypothetical protein
LRAGIELLAQLLDLRFQGGEFFSTILDVVEPGAGLIACLQNAGNAAAVLAFE